MKLVWGRWGGGKNFWCLQLRWEAKPGPRSLCHCFWRQWASTSGLTFHPDLTIVLHRYGRRDCNAALPLPRPLRLSDEQKYFTDTPCTCRASFRRAQIDRLAQNDPPTCQCRRYEHQIGLGSKVRSINVTRGMPSISGVGITP